MRNQHPMRIGRLFLSAAVTLLACGGGSIGAEQKPKVGGIVIARRADVLLRIAHSRPVAAWGTTFRVRLVRGAWLWVGRGWLHGTDVLTPDDAVAYFTRVIEKAPSAFALISRGVARSELKCYDLARADFDEALRLAPRESRAFRERAVVSNRLQMNAAAIPDFTAAIELRPTDVDSYIGRALALAYRSPILDFDDCRLALDDLGRAIHLEARCADAYVTRASVLYRFGKLDSALTDANEAVRLDAWNPSNYTRRASIHLYLGHGALAAADFDFAERLGASKGLRKLYEEGALEPAAFTRARLARGGPYEVRPVAAGGSPALGTERGAADVFDIAKGPNPVVLPVTVQGNETVLHFMVDTGSRLSAISTVHQHLLGKKYGQFRVQTATGYATVPVHDSEPFLLGKTMLIPTWGVVCMDLRAVSLFLGTNIDGVLGSDVLRKIVLAIDFDKGKASVLPSADGSCGEPLRLIWHKGPLFAKGPFAKGPFVMASLNGGAPTEFLVDLGEYGCTSGSLSPDVFDSELRRGALRLVGGPKAITGAIGVEQLETRHARAGTLAVTRNESKDLLFARSAAFSSLGVGYLSRYAITLDLANNMMYLRPGEEFPRPDVEDQTGVTFIRREGELIIFSLRPDSPAGRSGRRRHDVVTHVDGVAASQTRFILDIERALCAPGRHVLRVRRDGVIHELAFRTEEVGKGENSN